MPIPNTGPISFSQLRSELKNTNTGPVALSELYYGSTYLSSNRAVPTPMKNLPTTPRQTKRVSQYRGSYGYFGRTITIDSNINDFRLSTNLIGWDTIIPVMADITVLPNVTVGGGWSVDVQVTGDLTPYTINKPVYRSRYGRCSIALRWVLLGTVVERNIANSTLRINYDPQITRPINFQVDNGMNERVHVSDNLRDNTRLSTDASGNNRLTVVKAFPSPSFEAKNLPQNSVLYLDNRGSIIGRGGVGGRGGLNNVNADGESGENGGTAIRVMGLISDPNSDGNITFNLKSSNNNIFGGGGGGGGGGADVGDADTPIDVDGAGGGGGGGAGSNPGLGNAGGILCIFGQLIGTGTSSIGADGTISTGGTGGRGASSTNNYGGRGGNRNSAGTGGSNFIAGFDEGFGGVAGRSIEGPVRFTADSVGNSSNILNITNTALIRI